MDEKESVTLYQCPCCDYLTLPERDRYEICPICFWEDDGQELDHLDCCSPPNNGITLREGRANFQRLGACEPEMVKHVLPEQKRASFEYRPRKIDEQQ